MDGPVSASGDPDVFAMPYRTRGYEAGPSRAIELAQHMRYFGALRWEVMLADRFHLRPELERGAFFVIHEQRVELVRDVGVGVDLRVELWWAFVGRSSVRIVQRALARGEVVAQGRVTCAWLGPQRRLARLPEAFREEAARVRGGGREVVLRAPSESEGAAEGWVDPPARCHGGTGLEAIAPPGAEEAAALRRKAERVSLVVRPSDVDIFGHVNATHYVPLFDDARRALGGTGRVVRAALAYAKETLAGERVDIVCRRGEDGWACGLYGTDEEAPRTRARLVRA